MKYVLTFIVLFFTSGLSGQENPHTMKPSNCEDTKQTLGVVHELSRSNTLIIIARLGNGESKRSLSKKRLNAARDFLESRWRRSPQLTTLADGDAVRGLGRLELYTNGDLTYVISLKKGANILNDCFIDR